MKFVYHIESPSDVGHSTDDQFKWATEAADPRSQELLASMRGQGAEVDLVETYVTVDSKEVWMGFTVPRVRLVIAVEVNAPAS